MAFPALCRRFWRLLQALVDGHVGGALGADFLGAGVDVDAEADALIALFGRKGARLGVTFGNVHVGKHFGHRQRLGVVTTASSHFFLAHAHFLYACFSRSAFCFTFFAWYAFLHDTSAGVLFDLQFLIFFAF